MKTILSELLDENEKYKQNLEDYTAKLQAELDSLNKLMDAVEHSENDIEPSEQKWCLQVTGAFKPVGVIDVNETLREDSPFYADAKRRERYIGFTTPPTSFGDSERQCLQKAIIKENKRKAALYAQQFGGSAFEAAAADDNTFLENTEGIDWAAVARDVSAWSHVSRTRTAQECKVRWLGAQHPRINTEAWSINENKRLSDLVEEERASGHDLDWEGIAAGLETNRTVLDCIRQYQTKVRSNKFIWTKEIDTKVLAAVEKYGIHNWIAVASAVSSELSPNQCQIRYERTLDPNLRRGKFTAWEDQELLNALEVYGADWMRVSQKIPGRSNTQCRGRYKSIMEASKARWNESEDENLMEAIKRHGTNWTNVEEELGKSRTVQDCRERYHFLTMSVSKPMHVNSGLKPAGATPDFPQNQEQQHIVDEAEPTSRKKSEAGPSPSVSQKATSPDSGVKDHSSSTNIKPTRGSKRKVGGLSNDAPSTEKEKDTTGPSAPPKKRTPRQVIRKKQTQETTIIEQKDETQVASGTAEDNNKRMTRSLQHRMTTRSCVKGDKGSITNQPPK